MNRVPQVPSSSSNDLESQVAPRLGSVKLTVAVSTMVERMSTLTVFGNRRWGQRWQMQVVLIADANAVETSLIGRGDRAVADAGRVGLRSFRLQCGLGSLKAGLRTAQMRW